MPQRRSAGGGFGVEAVELVVVDEVGRMRDRAGGTQFAGPVAQPGRVGVGGGSEGDLGSDEGSFQGAARRAGAGRQEGLPGGVPGGGRGGTRRGVTLVGVVRGSVRDGRVQGVGGGAALGTVRPGQSGRHAAVGQTS